MNETLLRNLLREWVAEEYAVTEIDEFADEFDASGQPIPHVEIYRRTCESRLAGLQKVAPGRTDLQEKQEAVLAALSSIRPDERLYYWYARGESREYSGVISAGGVISFYSVAPSPDDRNA